VSTVYLIDGYNVLHALRALEGRAATEPLDDGQLEDERGRLIDRISSFMGGTDDRAIIVFDSKKATIQRVQSAARNVEVYFASFSRNADTIIERETYALRTAGSIMVVTSDYGLQKTVFLPNVIRRSSRQFVHDLQDHTTKVANRENCITIGHRVEENVDAGTLSRLQALREQLERDEDSR
jgi:predicted RNA-binding protein with PIN domain